MEGLRVAKGGTVASLPTAARGSGFGSWEHWKWKSRSVAGEIAVWKSRHRQALKAGPSACQDSWRQFVTAAACREDYHCDCMSGILRGALSI